MQLRLHSKWLVRHLADAHFSRVLRGGAGARPLRRVPVMNTSPTGSLLLYIAADANPEDDTVRIYRLEARRDETDSEPLPDTERSPMISPRSCTREALPTIVQR